jgi:DNA polymerase III delta subunit
MAVETALTFLRSGDSGRPLPPVFLICGPQVFLREYALDFLRRRLARRGYEYRCFQVGAGDSFARVLDETGEPDLFAPKRLVACRVLRGRRERGGGDDARSQQAPAGSSARGAAADEAAVAESIDAMRGPSILALLYERETPPARIRRAAERAGLVITCERPFDNQLGQYAETFARVLGLKLSYAAADLLVSGHAGDLAAMANALGKAAIHCERGATVDVAELSEPDAPRVPELFDLADALSRGRASSSVALFDRAVHAGRDVLELLAVEIIPVVRRMLIAASMLEKGNGSHEIALALGVAPTSALAARAIDGGRRFGVMRLWCAHRRACELDAAFKTGLVKERGQAVARMLLELMGAEEERTVASRG